MCFGPVCRSSSGCPKNLLSDYTLCVVTLEGERDLVLHHKSWVKAANIYTDAYFIMWMHSCSSYDPITRLNMFSSYINREHLIILTCKLGSKTMLLRCFIIWKLHGLCKKCSWLYVYIDIHTLQLCIIVRLAHLVHLVSLLERFIFWKCRIRAN